jgi:hypothetical protein
VDVDVCDGVWDAVEGLVVVGNLVAVEADFNTPQDIEIKAKIATNSKLEMYGFCIDNQFNPAQWILS